MFRVAALVLVLIILAVPARADTPTEKGITLFFAENFTEAMTAFDQGLQDNKTDTFSMVMLLESARKIEKINDVVTSFEDRVKAHPDDPYLRGLLGLAYMYQGADKMSAVTSGMLSFEESLKLDPNCSTAHAGLGLYYFNVGKTAKARNQLEKAYEVNPNDFIVRERLGEIILVDDDKPEKAKPIFEVLARIYPNYPDAWFFLGFSQEKDKDKRIAMRSYEESIRLDPKGLTRSVYARLRIARLYKDSKMKDKAVRVLEDLVKLRPDMKEAQDELNELGHGK